MAEHYQGTEVAGIRTGYAKNKVGAEAVWMGSSTRVPEGREHARLGI